MTMKMRILISIIPTLYFVATSVLAANVVNITGVLDKGGQFTTFMSLLKNTQVGNQLQIQLNSSQSGLTIFAPTDNAFQGLKPGALNSITDQQKVALLLYHVLPTYYSMSQFQTLSNPVRTLASGNGGLPFGVNVTSIGLNQVNMSTGLVDTQIFNSLYSQNPLAVYQVDKVLLPQDIFGPVPKISPALAPVEGSTVVPHLPAEVPSGDTAATQKSGSTVGGGCVKGLFAFIFSCFVALFLL